MIQCFRNSIITGPTVQQIHLGYTIHKPSEVGITNGIHSSDFFSQNQIKILFYTLIPYIYCLIVKIDSFRGDLTDISAKTATLIHILWQNSSLVPIQAWSLIRFRRIAQRCMLCGLDMLSYLHLHHRAMPSVHRCRLSRCSNDSGLFIPHLKQVAHLFALEYLRSKNHLHVGASCPRFQNMDFFKLSEFKKNRRFLRKYSRPWPLFGACMLILSAFFGCKPCLGDMDYFFEHLPAVRMNRASTNA